MSATNVLNQVRPGSTFDTFVIYTPEQKSLVEGLRRLADDIIAAQDRILDGQYPFDNAKMLILWGLAGRGKSHLVEALINCIRENAPKLLNRMFLTRSHFLMDHIAGIDRYDGLPIVIIDDIFSDVHQISELRTATHIRELNEFVQMVYEERRLVIITSNFPFKDGILPLVEKVDRTGRIVSRLKELLARSGEIEVVGRDYREILSEELLIEADPFSL